MGNDRELIHAAMAWHTAHARRKAIGTEKRKLDIQLKAGGDGAWSLQVHLQQSQASRQLTEAKRRELAALRLLAKTCAAQRGQFDMADVIDLDGGMVLLPAGH